MPHPMLEAGFHALEQAGIRWCLLRLPSNPSASTGDVDLLVDRADAARMQRALEALAFVRLPAVGSGAELVFLAYHPPTDRWIRLHIVTELSFGPHYALKSKAEAGCLSRRRREGAMSVLARDDAFWVLLLHCMLDKRTVAPRHWARLQELVGAARTDGQLGQEVGRHSPAGWNAARLMACVRCGDWAQLERLAPSLAAAWMRQQPVSGALMSVRRGLRLPAKLRNRFRRRGVSVVLLGPDGAGKSTLASGIQRSFCFPVRSIYMGRGSHDLVPRLTRLRVPGIGAPGRLAVLWGRYLTAQYHRAWGRLVIFDRYSYDALLAPVQSYPRLKRASLWAHAHACPAPDLVLVLDAPAALMYERKHERNPADLETERQRLLALRQSISQLQVVDAARPADAVRVDAVDRIWQQYAARWRKTRR